MIPPVGADFQCSGPGYVPEGNDLEAGYTPKGIKVYDNTGNHTHSDPKLAQFRVIS